MKKIILFIIIITIHISGFSQSLTGNNSGWNNINIEENNTISEVKIYPNPCKNEIVTIEFNNREIKEIRLTNITGKEVLLKSFQFAENKKQIQLNEIPNGLYIIRIITSDQKQVVKKLMVAKK